VRPEEAGHDVMLTLKQNYVLTVPIMLEYMLSRNSWLHWGTLFVSLHWLATMYYHWKHLQNLLRVS